VITEIYRVAQGSILAKSIRNFYSIQLAYKLNKLINYINAFISLIITLQRAANDSVDRYGLSRKTLLHYYWESDGSGGPHISVT